MPKPKKKKKNEKQKTQTDFLAYYDTKYRTMTESLRSNLSV